MNENPLNPDFIIKCKGDIFNKGYYEIIKTIFEKKFVYSFGKGLVFEKMQMSMLC